MDIVVFLPQYNHSGMPLCNEIKLGEETNAAVWFITESMEELLPYVSLNGEENNLFLSFKNEHRKLQWLACRALLRHLVPENFPVHVSYDKHGKPSLDSAPGFISVSHAGNFAAAVYCKHSPVGIDIEQLRERIERVKERFLSKSELKQIKSLFRREILYICWGAKEALYKLHGKPDIDFKDDIYIHPFDYLCDMDGACIATLTTPEYSKEFRVFYKKLGDNMITVAS